MPRSFTQPPDWSCKTGGWDITGTREIFPGASPLGIPDLLPQDFAERPPAFRLLPYRSKRSVELRDVCHFYLDDYRFETTWNRLNAAVNHLLRYEERDIEYLGRLRSHSGLQKLAVPLLNLGL